MPFADKPPYILRPLSFGHNLRSYMETQVKTSQNKNLQRKYVPCATLSDRVTTHTTQKKSKRRNFTRTTNMISFCVQPFSARFCSFMFGSCFCVCGVLYYVYKVEGMIWLATAGSSSSSNDDLLMHFSHTPDVMCSMY